MPYSKVGIIEDIAQAHGIKIENTSVDCLLFIYAMTFKKSNEILSKKFETISKSSIEKIREAFEEIHIKFGRLKGAGKLTGKKYSDVEQISPLMEKALSLLIAVIDIHDQTRPSPPETPEKLRMRREALRLCSEDLLACRRYVDQIKNTTGWWCKEDKAKDCLNRISAPPPAPANINNAKKRRQRTA